MTHKYKTNKGLHRMNGCWLERTWLASRQHHKLVCIPQTMGKWLKQGKPVWSPFIPKQQYERKPFQTFNLFIYIYIFAIHRLTHTRMHARTHTYTHTHTDIYWVCLYESGYRLNVITVICLLLNANPPTQDSYVIWVINGH